MNNLMGEIKESIKEGIEEERVRMNQKCNENKAAVEKINSAPAIIKELVNIYGNTLEQRRKMISILKLCLKTDFFKSAEIIGGANYVYFRNGEYLVAFATSRIHTIKVVRTERLRKPVEPTPIREDILKFNELWNEYKRTGENFREVIDSYSNITRGEPLSFTFIVKVNVTSEIKDFAEKQKQHIKSVNHKIESWKINLEGYEKDVKLFHNVMDDLKADLIKFKDEGWHIKYENLQGLNDYEI